MERVKSTKQPGGREVRKQWREQQKWEKKIFLSACVSRQR